MLTKKVPRQAQQLLGSSKHLTLRTSERKENLLVRLLEQRLVKRLEHLLEKRLEGMKPSDLVLKKVKGLDEK